MYKWSQLVSKMAAMLRYSKNTKKFSSPEPRKLNLRLNLVIGDSRSSEDSRSTKFVQMMTVGLPLTLLRQGQICVPMYGEILKSQFLKMY